MLSNVNANELKGFDGYWYQIDEQLLHSIIGYNSMNHAAAIGGTTLLVRYDIDWKYYLFFNDNKRLQLATFPAVIIGGLGPVILPAYLHYTAIKRGDTHRLYTAYAVGQATILSIAITSFYKSITGRLEPDIFRETRSLEQSKQFEFGFWNNGIFNGWPSGHATTAMAITSSLTEMYPNKTQSHIWWYLSAIYISFGISTNIHWLSDALAGSLIGYGIGKSVGRAFYAKSQNRKQDEAMILPVVGSEAVGIMISRRF